MIDFINVAQPLPEAAEATRDILSPWPGGPSPCSPKPDPLTMNHIRTECEILPTPVPVPGDRSLSV